MTTEAGETLKRRRVGGPWIPDPSALRPQRGSSMLALDIASSAERRSLALSQFEELVYAPGTIATKDTLFRLWTQICERSGIEVLPVTCESLRLVSVILRASGFRAVTAYVYEAKGRHVRAGFAWSQQLDVAIQDVRRASNRAQLTPTRAQEIVLNGGLNLLTV